MMMMSSKLKKSKETTTTTTTIRKRKNKRKIIKTKTNKKIPKGIIDILIVTIEEIIHSLSSIR